MTTYLNRYYYLGPWRLKTDDMGQYWDAPDHTVGRIDLRPNTPSETYGFFSTDQQIVDSGYIYLGDDLYGDLTGLQLDAWKTGLGMMSVDGLKLIDVLWDTLTANADPEAGVRAYPIMPTHLGVLNLHLGGHSCIKSRQFQGEKDKSWKVVQKVLQDQFRNLDKLKENSKSQGDLQAKVLGTWKLKYKISDEGLFIPSDLPKIKAKKPTTKIGDTFEDAYKTLETHTASGDDGGFSWSVVMGSAGYGTIDSNTARLNPGDNHCLYRADEDLSSDDHSVQADLTESISNAYPGVIARKDSSSTATFYNARLSRLSSELSLYKYTAGTKTLLGTNVSVSVSLPDTLKIECDGSDIKTFWNTTAGPITDTAISGNVRTGIYSYREANFDNFLAEDLIATQLPKKFTFNIDEISKGIGPTTAAQLGGALVGG